MSIGGPHEVLPPHGVDLEFLVGDDPLQPGVLALQLAQPPGVVGLHPPVLVAPAVVGLLRDLDLLRRLGDRLPFTEQPLHLPQLPHDLLRRVPASFHRDVVLHALSWAKGLSSTVVPFQGVRSQFPLASRRDRRSLRLPSSMGVKDARPRGSAMTARCSRVQSALRSRPFLSYQG